MIAAFEFATAGRIAFGVFLQHEFRTEFRRQRIRVVAHDGQAAAFLGTVRRECSDDNLAARPQGAAQPVHISPSFCRLGQEMERGAIVPDVIAGRRAP